MLRQPRRVGAIAPSSRALSRAMAAQIPNSNEPVLELGPGTGRITEAILASGIAPARLSVVEFDEEFADTIEQRFPGVNLIRGNAFDLARTLGERSRAPYSAILSGLPLLNFPPEQRMSLLRQIFALMKPGAPFVQFSYGLQPPIAPPDHVKVARAAFVPFNIPPARVWVYRSA